MTRMTVYDALMPTTTVRRREHRPAEEVSAAAAQSWELVRRAQDGDREAFGEIYERYMDTVFRFVYFRVGNRPLAEDLTSDTFLRAFKRIGAFEWQGKDIGAWLVTIARNLVADHFKSGRYRLEVTTGDVLGADREDPEGSPESAVVDHITNVALLTAVKQLNPEQQECIVLRFLRGLSVAETAKAMGKNEGAIKALQYRSVRALARLLPQGFDPSQIDAEPSDVAAPPPKATDKPKPQRQPKPMVFGYLPAPTEQQWETAAEVREWARSQGIAVNPGGRVRSDIRFMYRDAMAAKRAGVGA